MKKIKTFLFIIIISLLVFPFAGIAQGPTDPEDTPIDGGLGLLIAAGAVYGIKKYRDSRKKNTDVDKELQ